MEAYLELYIFIKTLPIIKQVQILNYKEFVVAALDSGKKTFIIYISSLDTKIYLVLKAHFILLIAKIVNVLTIYLDFTNIVSKILVIELFK